MMGRQVNAMMSDQMASKNLLGQNKELYIQLRHSVQRRSLETTNNSHTCTSNSGKALFGSFLQTVSHSSCGHPNASSLALFSLLQSWHDFWLLFTSQPKLAISALHSSLGFEGEGLGGAAEQPDGRT